MIDTFTSVDAVAYRQTRMMWQIFVVFLILIGLLSAWLTWIAHDITTQDIVMLSNQKSINLNGLRLVILQDELTILRINEERNGYYRQLQHGTWLSQPSCVECHKGDRDVANLMAKIRVLDKRKNDLVIVMEKRMKDIRDLELQK